jgi:hypothetical protein
MGEDAAGGLVLVIAGVWVLAQVTKGHLLTRTGLLA